MLSSLLWESFTAIYLLLQSAAADAHNRPRTAAHGKPEHFA